MTKGYGRSPSGRATAVEPVPVSPLRDGIPSAGWCGTVWQLIDGAPEDEAVCVGTVDHHKITRVNVARLRNGVWRDEETGEVVRPSVWLPRGPRP
jgi:hypothetical protein